MKYIRICQCCGKKFTAQRSTTRYCSIYCSNRFKKALKRGTPRIPFAQKSEKDDDQTKAFNPDEVFSPCKAAEYLGIGKTSIYRYVKQGVIPVIHLTHATLIRKYDL
ncbi:MAG: helix-turn-helix domain-containing protein, partial [Bacteroidales bacterium]|nr:helix-turn-helix domain-containing protein [Bacteroidales bacterium]